MTPTGIEQQIASDAIVSVSRENAPSAAEPAPEASQNPDAGAGLATVGDASDSQNAEGDRDLETRIVAAELAGRTTVADLLARELEARRSARRAPLADNVIAIRARR